MKSVEFTPIMHNKPMIMHEFSKIGHGYHWGGFRGKGFGGLLTRRRAKLFAIFPFFGFILVCLFLWVEIYLLSYAHINGVLQLNSIYNEEISFLFFKFSSISLLSFQVNPCFPILQPSSSCKRIFSAQYYHKEAVKESYSFSTESHNLSYLKITCLPTNLNKVRICEKEKE